LTLAGPALADALADLLGIEAHQRHQGFIAEQPGEQRIHALDAEQRFQPVEQDVLHIGDHRALESGGMDRLQQCRDPDRLQEVQEIVQHRPFVRAVAPIDLLLAVQAPRHARIIPPGHLSTQPRSQVLGDLIVGVSYRPPPSADPATAIEESGRQIKASASVGISGTECWAEDGIPAQTLWACCTPKQRGDNARRSRRSTFGAWLTAMVVGHSIVCSEVP
jgi:hypothetical protein